MLQNKVFIESFCHLVIKKVINQSITKSINQDDESDGDYGLEEVKRAWNSGFNGGVGKRAWNSGFNGGVGKRAWNSGFNGGVGKRAWNNFAGG